MTVAEIIAGYRHACAAIGPCSANGDGCSCTDSELAVRHFRKNLEAAMTDANLTPLYAAPTPPQNTDGEAVAWEHRLYYDDTGKWSEWRPGKFHRTVSNPYEERALVPASALSAMKAERDALHQIIADLFAPDGHQDGCLFKADPRMPCQCDYHERMGRYRKAVDRAKEIAVTLQGDAK